MLLNLAPLLILMLLHMQLMPLLVVPALLDLWSDWDGLQADLPKLRAEREQMLRAKAESAATQPAVATPIWGQAAKL